MVFVALSILYNVQLFNLIEINNWFTPLNSISRDSSLSNLKLISPRTFLFIFV